MPRLVRVAAAGTRRKFIAYKGDILRIQGKSVSEIEPHYEAAIAVAKRQGARAWELRAAVSLDALRKREATTSAPCANVTLNLS